MNDFCVDDNPCGKILVHFASRGNAIIAELLRLKDYVPPIFKLDNKQDLMKYGEVIVDFVYFKTSDEFEKKMEKFPHLQATDSEIRDGNMEILNRFFSAFESIHKYASDLNQFVEELNDGIYLQNNLQNLFCNGEAKQLLCEILYLYGVMLLVLDVHIGGIIRERLLVSHYRYCAPRYSGTTTVDDVCKLVRCTGLDDGKRQAEYPVDYFKRIRINEEYIDMVIDHLRMGDVYNQISAYPKAEHRSTAFSLQATMLFVCLFFDSSLLHRQSAKMREIVDKYFPDNWVTSIYMGVTLNIIDLWEPFKAAKMALANTLESDNVNLIASNHHQKLNKCMKQIQQLLKEGAMDEEKIYDSTEKLVNLCRECNVTLRWLILHSIPRYAVIEQSKRCKVIRDQILAETKFGNKELLHYLLNVAQFEDSLKAVIKKMLDKKEENWNLWKSESIQRMRELSEAFTGEKPLTKITKHEALEKWFANVANEIESLSIEKSKYSSNKIVQVLKALENVQGFHGMSSHHQVVEYIRESSAFLRRMHRILNIEENVFIDLQIIGDFSYAWFAIDNFTLLMQDLIKIEPSSAIKLRALFLKLSSALETPLIRINQACSDDLVSVSQYYSQELVSYIRRVLHIIPETMFVLMTQIIRLQTDVIKDVPVRLEKDKIKDFAQLEERMEVARLTHAVSILSEGILAMKSTLVGIVKVNPKKLLEDGIRRELVKYIATAFHENVNFNTKNKRNNLVNTLNSLSNIMDGYRRSFEYIQDYIGIYGLKIWQEELSRIIGYSVEMECNRYLRSKIHAWQSTYQNKTIPIPDFPSEDNNSSNFIGRLLNELIRITDPKSTTYVENSMAWYDRKTRNQVFNFKVFTDIRNSFGVSGLTGLDKLLSFIIVINLQSLLNAFQKDIARDKTWSEFLANAAKTLDSSPKIMENPQKIYGQYLGRFYKIPSQIMDSLLIIGQLQILRKHISYELQVSCKFNSKKLFSCLEVMNESLMREMRNLKINDETSHLQGRALFEELNSYFNWSGICDPLEKVYITASSVNHFTLFISLLSIFQLSKLQWQPTAGTSTWQKNGDPIDGIPFVIGLQTVFRQFHPDHRSQYLQYLSQCFSSHLMIITTLPERTEILGDLRTALQFLYAFINYSKISKFELNQCYPREAVFLFETLSM